MIGRPMILNRRRGTTIPAIVPPERFEPDLPAVSVSGFLIVEVVGCNKLAFQVVAQVHELGSVPLASR